jgi:cell pole-organizing protein PopZ
MRAVSEGKTQQEPSMEEILASIRRIISEDGKPEAAAPKAADAARAEPAKADVLELTEVVEEDGSVVSLSRNEIVTDPEEAAPLEAEPEDIAVPEPEEAPHPPARPAVAPAPQRDHDALVSAAAAAAAAGAFTGLNNAANRTNAGPILGTSGRTVEDLVVEALRPMLREWLDANLPKLTERLVKREIARLARRAEEE